MKRKYRVICKIEFHDLVGDSNFFELCKFGDCRIKIDGKDYYVGKGEKDCVSFIEFEQSEHEIEIGDSIFKN